MVPVIMIFLLLSASVSPFVVLSTPEQLAALSAGRPASHPEVSHYSLAEWPPEHNAATLHGLLLPLIGTPDLETRDSSSENPTYSLVAWPPEHNAATLHGLLLPLIDTPDQGQVDTNFPLADWPSEDDAATLLGRLLPLINTPDTGQISDSSSIRLNINYPAAPACQKDLVPLFEGLSKDNMRENLKTFTDFHNRYFLSPIGRQSAEWLLNRVNETAFASGAEGIAGFSVKPFEHVWKTQISVLASIPGRTERTVVIGAHQDSVNLGYSSGKWNLRAPGADDDGSGTVTILEVFRMLILHLSSTNTTLENTVEFHWYSAEEGGLLGSKTIFSSYKKEGRNVVAMLHQDMTGYIQGTLDAGKKEAMGLMTDNVDKYLTEFVKKLITEYCDIPYVVTKCGYHCSDHVSATEAGYPSSFVFESEFEDDNKNVHSCHDTLDLLDFNHMREHAKLTLAFAVELGSTEFGSKQKFVAERRRSTSPETNH